MIIINALINTMENGLILNNAFIQTKDGIITAIGKMGDCPSDDSFIYDAAGRTVLPGFVDAHCHIGMVEDGLREEGDDLNEDTDPITPQLRAIDAVNPMENSFKEAAEAGVTTVLTGPGSANCIAGNFAAMKTFGICVDDMVIKENAAMKFAFGENPKRNYKRKGPATRMAAVSLIRETLIKAREYARQKERYIENPSEFKEPDFNFKYESLIPLLKGEVPMKAHAHRADDIFSAIRIAKEFSLKLTLDHCTEGHLIVDKLKALNAPCLVGPSMMERSKPEVRNLTFETCKILDRAGILVSIVTDHPVVPIKYLPIYAGLAVREGMDKNRALMAITINPAKSAGIDDKVGSLKVGKHGDMLVFSKDPLSDMAKPDAVFIEGRKII